MQSSLRQYVSFGIIGAWNTIVDIASYSALVTIGLPVWSAVIISTSVGLLSSFILNRRFTFGGSARLGTDTIVSFLCVTLTGLWLIQPLIIAAMAALFSLTATGGLVAAKLVATAVTMVWNFGWYRWYVFR